MSERHMYELLGGLIYADIPSTKNIDYGTASP